MKKIIFSLIFTLFSTTLFASDLSIDLLIKRKSDKARMVYSIEVAKIDAGQTIKWVAADKGHNVEFIAGPEGFEIPKKSKLSEDYSLGSALSDFEKALQYPQLFSKVFTFTNVHLMLVLE